MMNLRPPIPAVEIATALLLETKPEEARQVMVNLLKDHADDPRVQFNYGWYLCRDGKWKEAADCLDFGRFLNVFGSARLNNGIPIWQDEPLKGRTLHLRCEGGYGDEIINVRFARDFARRGARVVVSCSPSLTGVFSRLDGVAAVVGCEGAEHVHADYWVPAMSAMRWFPPTGEPYLSISPARAARWRDHLQARGRKVGIRWSGNPRFENDQHRRFSPQLMTGLAEVLPDATWYSFQRDENLVSFPLDLAPRIVDLRGHLTDWEDTAAALARMDLVITSCTSIAHLAGALGVPTWVVVPVLPYFCWAMPGELSPWYDSVTIFRQEKFGDWAAPFDAIRRRLATHFTERRAA